MTINLVKCADYNGHKDVMFCMEANDFRMDNGNYTKVSGLKRQKGNIFVDDEGNAWKRHVDWSMSRA